MFLYLIGRGEWHIKSAKCSPFYDVVELLIFMYELRKTISELIQK